MCLKAPLSTSSVADLRADAEASRLCVRHRKRTYRVVGPADLEGRADCEGHKAANVIQRFSLRG